MFRDARYNGFTWELERVIAPVPAPQPAPIAASTPTPLRVVKSVEPAVLTTVIVGSIQMTVPEGSSVRLEQDGKIVIVVSSACEMTVTPAAAEQAAPAETKAAS